MRKLLALVLSLALCLSLLGSVAMAEDDLSQRADLVFFVMGDAPADEVMVEDAVNEILLEKFNATIDFQFATWTDYRQKYNMTLTGGAADLIYIANWMQYGSNANAGAFTEITDDMLAKYAPEIVTACGDGMLDQCRVNGALYAIPNTWLEYTSNGLVYREDIRKAYDLPVPNSIENLEAYLLGVKENLPDQKLMALSTEESSTGIQVAFDGMSLLSLRHPWVTVKGLPYGLTANYDTPNEVTDYWFSDEFVEDCKLMKKWADLGFWSRSALSDPNAEDAIAEGIGVVDGSGRNPAKYISAMNKIIEAGHDDWEVGYVAYGEITGAIYPCHATQNGTAIVNGCKYPERALSVLNYLLTDKAMNELVQCGILGYHYTLDDNGVYQLTDNSVNFGYEGFNTWALRNNDYKIAQPSDTIIQGLFDKYREIGAKNKYPNLNIYEGFSENYNDYSVERANIDTVMKQYLAPIQAGLVDDVDAAIAEFREKITNAGLETAREGFKAQWLAYCDEFGYNK